MDDLNEVSEHETTLMTEILGGNNEDGDQNESEEEIGDDDDETGGGIEIPKHITPVNEVEEFFRVHLVDSNNKVKEKLAHNALFDLFSAQVNTTKHQIISNNLTPTFICARAS